MGNLDIDIRDKVETKEDLGDVPIVDSVALVSNGKAVSVIRLKTPVRLTEIANVDVRVKG